MEALLMLCALLITFVLMAWVLRERRHRAQKGQWMLDRRESEKKNTENERLRGALKNAGRQIAKLKERLSRRVQEVGELTQRIEFATDINIDLQATLDRKVQEIDCLKKTLQRADCAGNLFFLEQVEKKAFAEGRASAMEEYFRYGKVIEGAEYVGNQLILEQVKKRAFAEEKASVMRDYFTQGQAVSFLPSPEEGRPLF